MADEDLKSCPFCGNKILIVVPDEFKLGAQVVCLDCCAKGPSYTLNHEAIKKWNTRK